MDAKTFRDLQVSSARWTLVHRQEALKYANDARLAGHRKEARFWDAQVRKLDKLIQEYGLDRYA